MSDADEGGIEGIAPERAVLVLAERKARAVSGALGEIVGDPALVVGCDSMFEFGDELWGKPSSIEEVGRRWRLMRRSKGVLHTGHFVLDTSTGRHAGRTDSAVVHFGDPSDSEIAAYGRTAEAMAVAGPFTLEGRSAPWVVSIEGNYGTITGISLVVLRLLLGELGVELVDLWH